MDYKNGIRSHLAWGDGNRDLAQYMKCLKENHYEGQLGLELTDSRYLMHPEEADRRCLKALKPYIV